MPKIYYAQAATSEVADAFRMTGAMPEGTPEMWHFASLDGHSYYQVTQRPSGLADFEALDKHVNKGGTLPMSLARDLVQRMSDGIEEIEV